MILDCPPPPISKFLWGGDGERSCALLALPTALEKGAGVTPGTIFASETRWCYAWDHVPGWLAGWLESLERLFQNISFNFVLKCSDVGVLEENLHEPDWASA